MTAVVAFSAAYIRTYDDTITHSYWKPLEIGVVLFTSDRCDRSHVLMTLNNGKRNLFRIARTRVLGSEALISMLVCPADSGDLHLYQQATRRWFGKRVLSNSYLPGSTRVAAKTSFEAISFAFRLGHSPDCWHLRNAHSANDSLDKNQSTDHYKRLAGYAPAQYSPVGVFAIAV